jgi:hypothetical protein
MKTVLLVTFIALALSSNLITDLQAQADGCFANTKSLYERTYGALRQNNIEAIIRFPLEDVRFHAFVWN